eukprot:scaffold38026_cov51-Phaeocystis_antarctica.AAC.1
MAAGADRLLRKQDGSAHLAHARRVRAAARPTLAMTVALTLTLTLALTATLTPTLTPTPTPTLIPTLAPTLAPTLTPTPTPHQVRAAAGVGSDHRQAVAHSGEQCVDG